MNRKPGPKDDVRKWMDIAQNVTSNAETTGIAPAAITDEAQAESIADIAGIRRPKPTGKPE